MHVRRTMWTTATFWLNKLANLYFCRAFTLLMAFLLSLNYQYQFGILPLEGA